MVNKYRIHDTHIFDDEVFMRSTTLSVSAKKQTTIGKSLDKRYIDKKIVSRLVTPTNNLINEIYLNMDLKTLREIDSDDDARAKYIRNNASFLNSSGLNVFFVNIDVNDEMPNKEDVNYLNLLLTWGLNDLYVMPTLTFNGIDRTTEKQYYMNFVSEMLECKNTVTPGYLNVGMNIPPYFRHRDVNALYEQYAEENNEPTFVAIDFNRTGMNDTKRMGLAGTINKHYHAEGVEDYFLYGFNVRSFTRSVENPLSDEMVIARSGFNCFGAPHYRPSKRDIPATTDLRQLGRIFEKEDYRFHPLTEKNQFDILDAWISDNDYSVDLRAPLKTEAQKIRPVMKKFNLCKENEEFTEISIAIRKNDSDILKEKKTKGL